MERNDFWINVYKNLLFTLASPSKIWHGFVGKHSVSFEYQILMVQRLDGPACFAYMFYRLSMKGIKDILRMFYVLERC